MTDAQAATLIELVTAQTAMIREIRDLMAAALLPEDAVKAVECEHPEKNRADLSTPRDANHWVCNICRFDNTAT